MNFVIHPNRKDPLPPLPHYVIQEKDWVTVLLGHDRYRDTLNEMFLYPADGQGCAKDDPHLLLDRHRPIRRIGQGPIFNTCWFEMPAWLYIEIRKELVKA